MSFKEYNSRKHALLASEYLAAIEAGLAKVQGMDQGERLQMMASGATKQFNANQDFTRQLAQAHALTAIALKLTGGEISESGFSGAEIH